MNSAPCDSRAAGLMAADNNYLFTGREYDWQTGVYYYRARSYDADLGRFLQQDPAGMVDGPNMYAYCGNDPVGRRDPTGMKLVLNSEKCMNCISNVLLDAMGESTYNSVVMAASCIMGHLSAEVVLFLFGTGALSFEPTIVANTQGVSVVVGSSAVAGFITMIALCIPLAFAVTAWKEILNCGASSLTYDELQDYSMYYAIITTLPTSEHFSPSYSYISPISIGWVYSNYNPKKPYSLR